MLLRLDQVCKTYYSGPVATPALRDVSMQIKQGDFIVILGPSGSGKTTLLNVISGLDRADSGTIWFGEHKLSGLTEEKLSAFRRRHLGFVFQQYNLLQNLTVFENTQIGADIGKEPFDVDETLEKVGLADFKDKYPYQLSGGEQQRVSIARSLAKNPDLLFCDEPTGSLDETTAKQVLGIMESLNQTLSLTVVIITHNPAIAAMADRIVRMNSGRVETITENQDKKEAAALHWG